MKVVGKPELAERVGDLEYVRVTIVADTTPATLPTTGEEVEGMTPAQRFAPLSVLLGLDTKKVYLAGEDHTFKEW